MLYLKEWAVKFSYKDQIIIRPVRYLISFKQPTQSMNLGLAFKTHNMYI